MNFLSVRVPKTQQGFLTLTVETLRGHKECWSSRLGAKAAEGNIRMALSFPGTVGRLSHECYTSWCLQDSAIPSDPASLLKVTYPYPQA